MATYLITASVAAALIGGLWWWAGRTAGQPATVVDTAPALDIVVPAWPGWTWLDRLLVPVALVLIHYGYGRHRRTPDHTVVRELRQVIRGHGHRDWVEVRHAGWALEPTT